MTGTTISAYTATGLTLSSPNQNPVIITATGTIISPDANAIYGVSSAATTWTIENSGTLKSLRETIGIGGSVEAAGVGISLVSYYAAAGSGVITNSAAGYILGNKNGIYFYQMGSVDNAGTIKGESGNGIIAQGTLAFYITNGSNTDTTALIAALQNGVLGGHGYLANYGTIRGGLTGVNLPIKGRDTIINGSARDTTALIAGNYGGVVEYKGDLLNYGTISTSTLSTMTNYGVALLGNGTVTNHGLIEGAGGVLINYNTASYAGGTLINAGTIISASTNAAAVALIGGTAQGGVYLVLDPGSEISGFVIAQQEVVMKLAAGSSQGTVTGIGTQYTGIPDIVIDKNASWVLSGDSAGLAAGQSISGFNHNDTLFLYGGFQATSSQYADGELTLSNGSSIEILTISADTGSPTFVVTPVLIGTEITLCFLRGTRIATPRGEVAIEDLAIGDAVMTRFGGVQRIKWIGRQSYDLHFAKGNPAKMPVRIAAGALGENLPRRDLFVSPGHSVLLGSQLILAQLLVNGVTITQGEAPARIDYFHIDLATHDCVLAEGIWAESFADGPGLRAPYHNTAEFHALYPDDVTPEALQLCAPRPEHGPDLETALLPVLLKAAAQVPPGELRGFIDEIGGDGMIKGWAQDARHPALPVALAVLYQGEVIGITVAREYRDDLAAAGFGSGRCGFRFQSWPGLVPHDIMICRVTDGATLPPEAGLRARLAA